MKKMRKKVLSGNEYTKLGQSDEEIACQFSWQQNHRHGNDARKRLVTACFFCILFIVCEVTGGFMANSLAVMNDALHQVFDLSSLLMSLIASWIARWKPNENKTFGYHRAEILGACLVIVILWLLTGVLAYESLLRILPGQTELHGHVNSGAMIVTAAFAFVANLVIICVLNVHHSGHQCEPANITVRAAFLHTLGDVMHSFAVLVGAIIIKIKPSWEIADPILSLAGACIVLFSTLTVLRDSINILLEGVPFNIRLADVKKDLSRLDHVTSVHNVHVWSLTAGKTVLSAHLVANPGADVNKLLREATCKMSKEYDFFHSCLQVEIRRPQNEHCFSKSDAKTDPGRHALNHS